eukprot:3236092-Rhodomonas_salina.2
MHSSRTSSTSNSSASCPTIADTFFFVEISKALGTDAASRWFLDQNRVTPPLSLGGHQTLRKVVRDSDLPSSPHNTFQKTSSEGELPSPKRKPFTMMRSDSFRRLETTCAPSRRGFLYTDAAHLADSGT